MFESLHFIHPLWLLALIPLALLAWRVCRPDSSSPWQRVVDARLLPLLMSGQVGPATGSRLWLVACGWLIATLALADPAWEHKPQPVFQSDAARVVVLDLSSSMNATDLKPSRLERARYKVDDVLSLGAEGQTGLVVYAGGAFTVTPLTRDANTIRSQLKALAPDLMPSDGSRADLGLLKAEDLLRHAGVASGQVLLIADGVESDALAASQRVAARLKRDGYRVSVLAVGAAAGADPNAQGGIPVAPTDRSALRSIAEAGGGSDLSIDEGIGPLRTWIAASGSSQAATTAASKANTLAWKEEGPLIALLLLPLAALAFRRRWLLGFMVLPLLLTMQPHDAMASTWDDLWQRPDQQAARSMSAGDYAKAAQIAPDPARRGSAEYKRGDYAKALDAFSQDTGKQTDYNRGNALARLGRYPDAVAAYDKALEKDPGDADARANKAAVEALLKKQKDDRPQQQQQQQQQPRPQPQSGPQPQSQPGSSGAKGDAKQDSKQDSKQDASRQASSQDGKQAAASGGKPGDQGNAPPSKPQADASQAGSAKEQTASANGTHGAPQDGAAGAAGSQGSGNPSAAPGGKPGDEFADAARKLAAGERDSPSPTGAQHEAAADRPQSGAQQRTGSTDAQDRAQPLQSEEQVAAEQWLRRIPDDPGGLLRRKFLYQYRQQAQGAPADDQ